MANKIILLSKILGAGGAQFENGAKRVLGEGKVLKQLPTNLPKEVADFVKKMPKGNQFKPLQRDTVYLTPNWMEKGTLDVAIPFTEHGHFGTCLPKGFNLADLKEAIAKLKLDRKRELALCRYSKNPTQANYDKALRLFPAEHRENVEFLLKSAKEQERWKMM